MAGSLVCEGAAQGPLKIGVSAVLLLIIIPNGEDVRDPNTPPWLLEDHLPKDALLSYLKVYRAEGVTLYLTVLAG